jgi:hypothetical protein
LRWRSSSSLSQILFFKYFSWFLLFCEYLMLRASCCTGSRRVQEQQRGGKWVVDRCVLLRERRAVKGGWKKYDELHYLKYLLPQYWSTVVLRSK